MTSIKNSGYSHHGASHGRIGLMSWVSQSKSPHEDISENLETLRNRSRDLYAGGGPIGRGAIDRLVLNTLGNGLRLNVRIDPKLLGLSEQEARDFAVNTESEFDLWASSKQVDIAGMLSFYELQVLAFKALLLDGDCLVLLTDKYEWGNFYSLRLQLIESERLCTPRVGRLPGVMIDEGVEIDELGNPVAYWVSNRNPNSEIPGQPALEWKRIPAHGLNTNRRNVIHLINPERIGQRRGVPYLSPVIEQLKQLGRYTDAELMAAVISGMYAVFFEHEFRPDGEVGAESYATEEGLGEMPELEGLSQRGMYGMIMDLPEGVKPVTVSPGRPNTCFEPFVQALVRQIGGCLGIPAELLYLHFTASYSASRGALLEAWKLFRYWRTWFAENFCQPVYREWFMEAVIQKALNAPGYMEDSRKSEYYTWAEWTGPSQGQLDPVKEVKAAVLRVENGFSTYQRETGELTGGDYDLNMQQLKREEVLRKERENV